MRLRACVFAVGAAVVSGGCSVGGDSEPRLTRDEFVAQANAICARYQARYDKLPQPRNLREYRTYMARVVPIARREVAELDRLRPPEADEEAFDRLVDNARETAQAAERLRRAAADAQNAELELLFDHAAELGRQGDALARELDLERCIDRV